MDKARKSEGERKQDPRDKDYCLLRLNMSSILFSRSRENHRC